MSWSSVLSGVGNAIKNGASAVGKFIGSNANSIMSGVSSVGSALLANASSKAQAKYQKQLMEHQAKLNYDYSIKSAQNMPSANRFGLESAGYNPMLAVQNATSGANSSWTSGGQASAPDFAGASQIGVSNAQSVQRLKNETLQAESTSDANYAAADKAKAEKAEIIERLPYVSDNAKADYMKKSMETAKLENDIHYQNEYLNYLENSLEIQERLGLMGIDVTKRGQNISNATDILKTLTGAGLTVYGLNKAKVLAPLIKGAGDLIKVNPFKINY